MKHTLKSLLLGIVLAFGVSHASAEIFTSKITPTHSGDSFQFLIPQDSLLSLTPTLTGELTAGNSGFYISTLPPSDPAYNSTKDVVRSQMPATGDIRGPWPLKAGTYFLNLWNNNWNTGSYTANLNMVLPATANDDEPNDTPALAKVVPPGSVLTGLLGFYSALDDSKHDYGDYYRLTLPSRGFLSFADEKDSTLGGAFGFSLYQADGTTSIYDPRGELDAGDYLLLVWTNSGSAYGGYRLQVGFTPSASPSGVGAIHILTPPVSARDFSPLLAFAPVVGERNGSYNLYVAGLYQGQFYFLSVRNWQMTIIPYFGGEMPVYQVADGAELYGTGESGTGMQTWNIPLGDISSLAGLQIYAGFGRNEQDMLNRNQVQLIYTVE